MDEKNERAIWAQLLKVCKEHQAQYFYMAPKFPYSLPFNEQVRFVTYQNIITIRLYPLLLWFSLLIIGTCEFILYNVLFQTVCKFRDSQYLSIPFFLYLIFNFTGYNADM